MLWGTYLSNAPRSASNNLDLELEDLLDRSLKHARIRCSPALTILDRGTTKAGEG